MNLNQITVPGLDVEKSIAFYEMLGLKLIVKALPHYARFECPEGNSTFSLHQVENLPRGEGIWIYFEVQDLDEYITAILEKGIKVEELPNNKPWLWRESRLKDPENNQLLIDSLVRTESIHLGAYNLIIPLLMFRFKNNSEKRKLHQQRQNITNKP